MVTENDIPIKIDKEILSGTPVFEGTRVPVSALLDNLEAGISLDEFLENFPTVTREQAVQVLGRNKTLEELVAECEVDIGIPDLAEQHDHYLNGTPKREISPHEVDELVIAQSDDDDEWEEAIIVNRDRTSTET
jgi:uncharacterized protein (DUF433 family)